MPDATPRPVVLPYPISANRYWRSYVMKGRAVVVVSAEAKAYRVQVERACIVQGLRRPIAGRVAVTITIHPKSPQDAAQRMRKHGAAWSDTVRCIDIDNGCKVLLDALKGIAYVDDEQVWKLYVERGEPKPKAFVRVAVAPIHIEDPQLNLLEEQTP